MSHQETKKKRRKKLGLYMKNIITRKITLPYQLVGSNIENIIQIHLKEKLEGRCTNEGFIKPQSIQILSFSSGVLSANNVNFDVVLECLVCRPVEGMKFGCVVKNITKAGIRAERKKNSPVVVFIARDHQYQSKYFTSIKEDQEITIKVIGQRFELNDKYISIIANLVEPKH